MTGIPRWNKPANDYVLFQATQRIRSAFNRGFNQNPGRVLEGSRGEERFRGKRDSGNAQKQLLGLGQMLPLALQFAVYLQESGTFQNLSHDQIRRVAGVFDPDAREHLTGNDFDMLVVDGGTLRAVDFLHLADDVADNLRTTAVFQKFAQVDIAFHYLLAPLNRVANLHEHKRGARNGILQNLAVFTALGFLGGLISGNCQEYHQ